MLKEMVKQKSIIAKPIHWLATHQAKFSIMLAVFLLLFILQPLADSDSSEKLILDILLTLVIFSAVHTASSWRIPTVLAVTFGSISLIGEWVSYFYITPLLVKASLFSGVLTMALCMYLIMRVILSARRVNFDAISGAICIYLLIGILGGLLFMLIEYHLPGSFLFNGKEILSNADEVSGRKFSDLIYFSYITITSVGFGDIVPIGKMARSMTIVMSITGQMYVTIVMAILVGVYINELMRRRMIRHERRSMHNTKMIEEIEKQKQ